MSYILIFFFKYTEIQCLFLILVKYESCNFFSHLKILPVNLFLCDHVSLLQVVTYEHVIMIDM